MAEESLNSVTPIIDRDIPMTVNEALTSVTVGKGYVDIPMTVNEVWIGMTIIVGMPDESKRNFITKDNVSLNNQTKQTGLYIDCGNVLVPAQSDVQNNQIGT